MTRVAVVLAAGGVASAAWGQVPGLALRFGNGTNQITVAPGTAVPVQIWTTGMPNVGTVMPWTTPPGTGQPGTYQGFRSVLMNITATGGAWSGPAIPIPPFVGPPFGNLGTISGSNVNGINVGVGFNQPVTTNSFLLWSGMLTVGSSTIDLATVIQPIGTYPLIGFEVQLNAGLPSDVSHFMQAANGAAQITVPAPASLALVGLVLGVTTRRRKRA